MSLRILHITPWFKSNEKPNNTPFIYNHIKALQSFLVNHVLHIDIDENSRGAIPIIKYNEYTFEKIKTHHFYFKNFPQKWKLYELLGYWKIKRFLKIHYKEYDIINFYIAYPTAIYIDKFKKKYPNLIFTITEQWSAYHIGFSLPKKSKGRKRIENIFNYPHQLFVVSDALGKDIQNFCSKPIPYKIIPNIVDTEFFNYIPKRKDTNFVISSINSWSAMKNPFVLINAFKIVLSKLPNCKLILGGGGNILTEMKNLASELNLTDKIEFTGPLSKTEVANTLLKSNVYCQSSNYETFSVICIESLAAGTPVVATNIGGMKDYINETNGLLVDDFDPQKWANAMIYVLEHLDQYDGKLFSDTIKTKYNATAIGQLFYDQLSNCVSGNINNLSKYN